MCKPHRMPELLSHTFPGLSLPLLLYTMPDRKRVYCLLFKSLSSRTWANSRKCGGLHCSQGNKALKSCSIIQCTCKCCQLVNSFSSSKLVVSSVCSLLANLLSVLKLLLHPHLFPTQDILPSALTNVCWHCYIPTTT